MPFDLGQLTTLLGGDAVDNLADGIGAEPRQTQTAIAAALPLLLGALNRNTNSTDGAQALDRALSEDHDGSLLDQLSGFLRQRPGQEAQVPGVPARSADGGGILGHLFGGQLGPVEQALSQASGMSPEQSRALLMKLAPVVLAMLGRSKRQDGLDPAGLSGVLGQVFGQAQASAPSGIGGVLGTLLGGGQGGTPQQEMLRQGAGALGRMLGGKKR
jgi:hypothetical protein